MLNTSYAAVQQFQSQISSIKTVKSLKDFSSSLGLSISVQITSSSVWILNWDLTNKMVSGTLDLGIKPILETNLDKFEAKSSRTLRLDESSEIDLGV